MAYDPDPTPSEITSYGSDDSDSSGGSDDDGNDYVTNPGTVGESSGGGDDGGSAGSSTGGTTSPGGGLPPSGSLRGDESGQPSNKPPRPSPEPSDRNTSSPSGSSSDSGGGGGGFFGGVGDAFDDAADTVSDTVDDASRTVDNTVDRATDAANDVARGVDRTVDQAQQSAANAANNAGKAVDNTVDTAQDAAGNAAQAAAAAADHAAGSTDEAVGRTFDDQAGGGVADPQTYASAGDELAGSTDEAVAKQTDIAKDTYSEAGEQLAEGDVRGAAEALAGGVAPSADNLAGSTDEFTHKQAKAAATGITPHARISIGGDTEGAKARAKKDRVLAERAERGWNDVTGGNLPTVAEGGAMLYQGSEVAERMSTGTAHMIEEGSPTADMGPKIGNEHLGDVPGNVVGGLVGGIGMGVGAVGQLGPSAAADLTDPATKTNGKTPSEVVGMADMATNAAESQVRMATERPVSTGILFAAPALEAGPEFIKGYRSGRAAETIPYESITDASGARGGVSRFKSSTDAPTSESVSEVRSRAVDQPDVVQEAAGTDSVLYHTTGQKLGKSLEVGEGGSELPGLWTAPDANSVGLRSTDFGSADLATRIKSLKESVTPRKPDLSTSSDRVAAFEGKNIEGMPEWAQGSGYEVRTGEGTVVKRGLGRGEAKALAESKGGESFVAPDQTTAGYKFLDQQADPGTAYVRPKGSRTPELEAIYGPGTEFAKTTEGPSVNVRVGGREVNVPESVSVAGREVNVPGGGKTIRWGGEKVPMDFYRRAGEAPDEGAAGEAAAAGESTAAAGETATAGEIATSYTSLSEAGPKAGTPVQNYVAGFGVTGGAGGVDPTEATASTPPTSDPAGDLVMNGYGPGGDQGIDSVIGRRGGDTSTTPPTETGGTPTPSESPTSPTSATETAMTSSGGSLPGPTSMALSSGATGTTGQPTGGSGGSGVTGELLDVDSAAPTPSESPTSPISATETAMTSPGGSLSGPTSVPLSSGGTGTTGQSTGGSGGSGVTDPGVPTDILTPPGRGNTPTGGSTSITELTSDDSSTDSGYMTYDYGFGPGTPSSTDTGDEPSPRSAEEAEKRGWPYDLAAATTDTGIATVDELQDTLDNPFEEL